MLSVHFRITALVRSFLMLSKYRDNRKFLNIIPKCKNLHYPETTCCLLKQFYCKLTTNNLFRDVFSQSSHPHSTHHLIRSNKIHKRMFIHIFVKGQNFVAKNCNMYCNNVNKIKICIGNWSNQSFLQSNFLRFFLPTPSAAKRSNNVEMTSNIFHIVLCSSWFHISFTVTFSHTGDWINKS